MAMKYYDWTAHHAACRPDKTAIIDLHSGRELSYGVLDKRAARLTDWLRGQGVAKGDRIAFLAPNCPQVPQRAHFHKESLKFSSSSLLTPFATLQ